MGGEKKKIKRRHTLAGERIKAQIITCMTPAKKTGKPV